MGEDGRVTGALLLAYSAPWMKISQSLVQATGLTRRGARIRYFQSVFRSSTFVEIPLLEDRIDCIRAAGRVLDQKYEGSFVTCVKKASQSAAALVNILVDDFEMFNDRHRFEGKSVSFHKRGQILVADLWACFEGENWGRFVDIDQITMFAGEYPPIPLFSIFRNWC